MTLKDVVEKRYQGYVSIADIISLISEKYECTESEARHVLAEALQRTLIEPKVYQRGKLGPDVLETFIGDEVLGNLKNPERGLDKELCFAIPF